MKCVFLNGCTFSEKHRKLLRLFSEKAGEKESLRAKRHYAWCLLHLFSKRCAKKNIAPFFEKVQPKR